MPGQSGKTVATFMRSKTTAAAGSGAWMSNARIAVHTASSWKTQPEIWNTIASVAPSGVRITASPCRAIVTIRRAAPRPSSLVL